MTPGAQATKRVVQAAAAFGMTTNDWPLTLQSKEQREAWRELCAALDALRVLVAK